MINKKIRCLIISHLILGICLFPLKAHPKGQAFGKGFILSDDKGHILLSQNKDTQFVPASILKILTSLAAIQTLGSDHRFSTEYYFDRQSKNLYVKGKGDPLFISEEINRFCKQISLEIKSRQIHHIILDNHFFSERIRIPGTGDTLNPYDAVVGALCSNFNTVTFRWHPQKHEFVSGEPQTPLLSIFQDEIKKTHLKQGRIPLSEKQSRLYPGFLIKHFLGNHNIQVTGNIMQGNMVEKSEENKIFLSSYQLTDVIKKLLEYSNNFIANQVLLTMGAIKFGEPATLEKGVKTLQDYADSLGVKQISISEGSGLSRSNRISPAQMHTILVHFRPHFLLLKNNGPDYFKTGTLSDVRTRAGFIKGKNGSLYPYVIMVNQHNPDYSNELRKIIKAVEKTGNNLN